MKKHLLSALIVALLICSLYCLAAADKKQMSYESEYYYVLLPAGEWTQTDVNTFLDSENGIQVSFNATGNMREIIGYADGGPNYEVLDAYILDRLSSVVSEKEIHLETTAAAFSQTAKLATFYMDDHGEQVPVVFCFILNDSNALEIFLTGHTSSMELQSLALDICPECYYKVFEGDDFAFIIKEDGTAELRTRYYSSLSSSAAHRSKIDIPAQISGVCLLGSYKLKASDVPVTSIRSSDFRFYDNLTSISIPGSITYIGDRVFSGCEKLQEINFPERMDNLTVIGDYAFSDCPRLTSITLPEGVTSIGDYAFESCESLQSVILPDSVTHLGEKIFGRFDNQLNLASCRLSNSLTVVDDCLFSNCKKLTTVNIPDHAESIGDYVFFNCYSLTDITLPETLKSIGDSAFSHCNSLTGITIPESVTSIGPNAFAFCERLTGITIPGNETKIGYDAFLDCTSLSEVVLQPGVTSIGNGAFRQCNHLTGIIIPDGVTSIGDMAFYSCTLLKSITIPDSVEFIGNDVFAYCTNLTDIQVSPGSYAYNYCLDRGMIKVGSEEFISTLLPDGTIEITGPNKKSVTEIIIPAEINGIPVTRIGDEAFSYCPDLLRITIPNGVIRIGDQAFKGCTNLILITLPASVEKIGEDVFLNCFHLDGVIVSAGSYADNYCRENKIQTIQPEDAYDIVSEGQFVGKILSDGTVEIIRYIEPKDQSVQKLTIPSHILDLPVTAIRGGFGSQNLTEITIPDSVTQIAVIAFGGCPELSRIEIPDSVVSIGEAAFLFCKKVKVIASPESYAAEYCKENGIPCSNR